MTEARRDDRTPDDDLVVRAKTEREAFGALYDRFFPLVHRYCRRRLCDVATADDLSSDVFLQVARAMRGFAGTSEEDFRRWVYRIATNAIQAHWRKNARRRDLLHGMAHTKQVEIEDGSANVDGLGEAAWEAVATELLALDEREQAVLSLRFMEGMSYDEVGKVLDARPGTIRVVASRAIENLRRRLSRRAELPALSQQKRTNP